MRARHGLVGTMVALTALACGDDPNEWDLVDTTGTRFHYACTDDQCSITGPTTECGSAASAVGSAILQICPNVGRAIYSPTCRPVACTSEEGCRTSFADEYRCVRGICQRPGADPLDWADLQILCLADVPRTSTCVLAPFEHPRIDLATAACPGDDPYRTCTTVPPECRQR